MLKKSKIRGIFFAQKDTKLCGKIIHKNSIIAYDRYTKFVYVCENFPKKYTGENPTLKVWVYDPDFDDWSLETLRNSITKAMWHEYAISGGCKKIDTEEIPANTCIRKKKGKVCNPRTTRNKGEIALSVGECIISHTFNAMPKVHTSLLY